MDSDGFGSLYDGLENVFGIDGNAGLTTFPILNVPMGGRSEGMAGSFSAVADDASFLEWNPAGSSMLPQTELAFFHNNWIGDTKVEGLIFTSRYKDLGFAAGGKWLYTPFSEYNIYGERVSKGYYSEAVAVLNASYNFFSGYYFSGLSVGMNLKGAFRSVPDYSGDNGQVMAGSGDAQSTAMAMADLGALTRFNLLKFYQTRERNTSAALVIRNLGPAALGDPLPTVATAALSYKPIRPLLVSFDFSVPANLMNLENSEKPYWAAGVSVAVTEFLSMRTGFLAKSGNVRLTLGSAVTLSKVALDINYTLDLLTQLTPMNRVSLGVRITLGDQHRKELSDRVDSLYLAGLNAYAEGNNAEAWNCWEEALRINPRFDPAREGLNNLIHSQEVEDRINSLERLDF
jgi:tetratricopeptide (TPR) repeat protein